MRVELVPEPLGLVRASLLRVLEVRLEYASLHRQPRRVRARRCHVGTQRARHLRRRLEGVLGLHQLVAQLDHVGTLAVRMRRRKCLLAVLLGRRPVSLRAQHTAFEQQRGAQLPRVAAPPFDPCVLGPKLGAERRDQRRRLALRRARLSGRPLLCLIHTDAADFDPPVDQRSLHPPAERDHAAMPARGIDGSLAGRALAPCVPRSEQTQLVAQRGAYVMQRLTYSARQGSLPRQPAQHRSSVALPLRARSRLRDEVVCTLNTHASRRRKVMPLRKGKRHAVGLWTVYLHPQAACEL